MTAPNLTSAGWRYEYDNDTYTERYRRNGQTITIERDEQSQKCRANAWGDRSRGETTGVSVSSKGRLRWGARDKALADLFNQRFPDGRTVREWALSPVTP